MANEGGDDIIVSQDSLSLVQGWLGSNEDPDAAEASKEPDIEESRPARLGLGARFVSHNQVTGKSQAVADKVMRKMTAKTKRRREQEENERVATDESDEDEGMDSRFEALTKHTKQPRAPNKTSVPTVARTHPLALQEAGGDAALANTQFTAQLLKKKKKKQKKKKRKLAATEGGSTPCAS